MRKYAEKNHAIFVLINNVQLVSIMNGVRPHTLLSTYLLYA